MKDMFHVVHYKKVVLSSEVYWDLEVFSLFSRIQSVFIKGSTHCREVVILNESFIRGFALPFSV